MFSDNPFYILGVNVKDDKMTIRDVAEEKSLEIDTEKCQNALRTLTNTKNRLNAELSWFLGVSQREIKIIFKRLKENDITILNDLMQFNHDDSIYLTYLNISSEFLKNVSEKMDITALINNLAVVLENINTQKIFDAINYNRTFSQFSKLNDDDLEIIEEYIISKQNELINLIINHLDLFEANEIVHTMLLVSKEHLENDDKYPSKFIEYLIDAYELKAQEALEYHIEEIEANLNDFMEYANKCDRERFISKSYGQYLSDIENFTQMLANWSLIAKPIILLAKIRGIDNIMGMNLGYKIRISCVELNNILGFRKFTKQFLESIIGYFKDIPIIEEEFSKDIETLKSIINEEEIEKEDIKNKEAKEILNIKYYIDVGYINKKPFKIENGFIYWDNTAISINSLTGLTWGGYLGKFGDNPIIQDCIICYKNAESEHCLALNSMEIHQNISNALYDATYYKIVNNMINDLKNGKGLRFGNVIVYDDRIEYTKFMKFYSVSWDDVYISNNESSIILSGKKAPEITIPYLTNYNSFHLENMIRIMCKRKPLNRLSKIFQEE